MLDGGIGCRIENGDTIPLILFDDVSGGGAGGAVGEDEADALVIVDLIALDDGHSAGIHDGDTKEVVVFDDILTERWTTAIGDMDAGSA